MKHQASLLLSLCLLVALTASIAASETDSSSTAWKQSLVIDVTATQTAYSDSWVGGEAT